MGFMTNYILALPQFSLIFYYFNPILLSFIAPPPQDFRILTLSTLISFQSFNGISFAHHQQTSLIRQHLHCR